MTDSEYSEYVRHHLERKVSDQRVTIARLEAALNRGAQMLADAMTMNDASDAIEAALKSVIRAQRATIAALRESLRRCDPVLSTAQVSAAEAGDAAYCGAV